MRELFFLLCYNLCNNMYNLNLIYTSRIFVNFDILSLK